MRRRALFGGIIGFLLALVAVLTPSTGTAAAGGDPYQRVTLSLAQGLVAMFPVAEGYVVSVAGQEAYIDLAEKDLMRPGMELQLYRPGAEMVHPVTKQVLGTFETDLGFLRLTEVREKYSRGAIEAAEGAVVAAGDRVRVSSRRLRALLSLAGSAPGVEAGPLALALLGRATESGRFTLVDEPVWAPSLAGATLEAVVGDPAALRALGAKAGADLLLLTKVEAGGRPIVTIDVRSLRTGTSLGVLREVWPAPGEPEPAAVRAGFASSPAVAPSVSSVPAAPSPASSARGEGEYVIRELPGGGIALAAGDILGEGRVELVISDGYGVTLYRWEQEKLAWRWDEGRRGGRRIVALDAADLDGDARAEVMISTVTWGRAATEIRSWRDGKLDTVGVAEGIYLRSMRRPGSAPVLLGQRAGIDEVLSGRVEEYRWRSGAVERVEGTALPRGVGIFGLALAPADSPANLYTLDRNNYLYGFDKGGKALWRSAREYGGYPAPLTEQDLGGGTTLTGEAFEAAMLAFQGRLLVESAAGGVQLAVPRNFSDSPVVLTRMRKFGQGQIVLLEAPSGVASLEEAGRSRAFDGYVPDLERADVDGDGGAEILFLVNRFAGPLLGDRAKLVAWRAAAAPGPGK